MTMKATEIYTRNLQEMRLGTRRVINQGGQYSGKTVNILGALATLCSEEIDCGVTTVTSMSMPHLKGGALRDFEMYVMPHFKSSIRKYHKTDHLVTFRSGAMMEFKAFDDEFKARGNKRKRLFVNEANKFEKMLFFQLDSRSDQTIIDYNPSIRFWAHDELIGFNGNVTLYSDHRHNPFLTESKHKEIENICQFAYNDKGEIILNEKGEPLVIRGDFELWKVYARGITGNVKGVIFPNWVMIDESEFPVDQDFIYAIDYGYTNDPTAIVKICKIGNTLFIKELAYETGIPPKQIISILKANDFNDTSTLYSEHDVDMVRVLRNLGIKVTLARKGQGSINSGISLLHTFDVKYTNKSQNLHRDRGLYVWEIDKKTGEVTNTPVDFSNHIFDAIRYGAYTKYLRKTL